MEHTPGPWRWEVSLRARAMQLCGGRPRFDKTVMDFTRWGMSGARIRLMHPQGPDERDLMLMENAETFCRVVPGREHHADWFQTIDHPDAHLIAAAPELKAALEAALARLLAHAGDFARWNPDETADNAAIALARTALAKADNAPTSERI
jgi:hypothetical protein